MKKFEELNLPGIQTRTVIKPLPGKVNQDEAVQLDLSLPIETKKKKV